MIYIDAYIYMASLIYTIYYYINMYDNVFIMNACSAMVLNDTLYIPIICTYVCM